MAKKKEDEAPVGKEKEPHFQTEDELAQIREDQRTDHIQRWQLDIHDGLDLAVQPLDEEPDVSVVALGIFKHTIPEDSPPLDMIDLQMLAINARSLALILHGYHRLPVADADLPDSMWHIIVQYQLLPMKSKRYEVPARTQEEALDAAQFMCQEEYGCAGKVLSVNGVDVVEGAD